MSDSISEASAVIAKAGTSNANLVYILYLVGFLTGLTALVGVIMAYLNSSDAGEPALSHYRFQIRTFWLGLLMLVVGGLTAFFVIGDLILLFWFVWTIVRILKGMKALSNGEPHPNPTSLLFG